MFRISTWGLLAVIAAATAYWYSKGASFDGQRTATWTDLGTWGDGGLLPAGVVGAALDGANKATPKSDKEPINKQAPPPQTEQAAKDTDWEVAKKEPAKDPSPAPADGGANVTAPAIDWPIAEAPIKWDNVRIAAPTEPEPEAAPAEPEVAGNVTAPAIEWPIADAPVKWDNVRAAAPEQDLQAAEAKAREEEEVRRKAEEAEKQAAEARAREEEEARRKAEEAEKQAAEARAREEEEARRKAEEAEKQAAEARAREEEEARRRAQLTAEQAACENELRKTYAEGIVLFETNSAQIDTDSSATLDALAKAAKSCAKVRIRVEGHTDDRGSNATNQALSERRAQAVASYLTGAGVDAGMISAYGYGEERPLVPNDSAANRQKNRRIVFTVY